MELKNYIEELSKNSNEPNWLLEKRLNAYSSFNQKPMPNFIYGLNIKLNIDLNLSDLDISKLITINKEIINKNPEVKIINLLGEEIYRKSISINGPFQYQLDVSNYAKGIYFLVLMGNGITQSQKIIIQ